MKSKNSTKTCVLFYLLTTLGFCSGQFKSPITDDVRRISVWKQNIPKDYLIHIQYIPKQLNNSCWTLLNIYPLEQSLKELSKMFGAISSNRENIIFIIAMLRSLRSKLDHEELEAAMMDFQCHYQEATFSSGLYFDLIQDILASTSHGTEGLQCKPPPCLTSSTAGSKEELRKHTRSRSTLWPLLLITVTMCAFLIILTQFKNRWQCVQGNGNRQEMCDVVQTVTVSIPPTTLTCSSEPSLLGDP